MKIINGINQIVNSEDSDTIIKFTKKYHDMDGKWNGYEFETSDMISFQVFDENGVIRSEYVSDTFRLEVAESYTLVLIAGGEEYYVMEDVDYAFDTEKLLEMVKQEGDNIPDFQEEYEEYQEEEGW